MLFRSEDRLVDIACGLIGGFVLGQAARPPEVARGVRARANRLPRQVGVAGLLSFAVALAAQLWAAGQPDTLPLGPVGPAMPISAALIGCAVQAGLSHRRQRSDAERNRVALSHASAILGAADVGYLLCEPDGTALWANPAARQHLGLASGEVPGLSLADCAPDRWPGLPRALQEVWLGAATHSLPLRSALGTPLMLSLRSIELDEAPYLLLKLVSLEALALEQRAAHEAREALEHANQELEAIYRHAQVGLAIFDGRHITWINEGAARIIGETPAELVGHSTRRFFGSDEAWAAVGQATWAAQSAGRPFDEEIQVLHRDGHLRWVRLSMQAVDPQARPIRSIAVLYDITLERRHRVALEEQNTRWQALMDNSSDAMHVLDGQGQVVDANIAFLKQLGLTQLPAQGLHLGEFDPSVRALGPALARERLQAMLLQPQRQDVQWRHASGELLDMEVSSRPTVLDGRPVVLASGRHIGARKRFERSLAQFHRYVDQAADCFYVVDVEAGLQLRYVNEAAVRHFGAPREVLYQWRAQDWDPQVDTPALQGLLRTLVDDANGLSFESVHALPDGRQVPVDVSVNCLIDDEGRLLAYGWFRDIRQQREARSALEAAVQRAEAASLAKSQFISTMSHELRTPLNAVLGYAQLLARADLPTSALDQVDRLDAAGHSLLGLIDDVLDIAKVEEIGRAHV